MPITPGLEQEAAGYVSTLIFLLYGAGAVVVILLAVIGRLMWPLVKSTNSVTKDDCANCQKESAKDTRIIKKALAVLVQADLKLCEAQGADCGELVGNLNEVYRDLVQGAADG